jgi:hypothetical protein
MIGSALTDDTYISPTYLRMGLMEVSSVSADPIMMMRRLTAQVGGEAPPT